MPDGIQILGQYTHVTDFGKRQTELALHIQQKAESHSTNQEE